MSRIVWDGESVRRYETGLDRGVLYPSGNSGVAWNGLLSVAEDNVGGDRNEYYRDGEKFADSLLTSFYSATLKAVTAPREFAPCVGEVPVVAGFYLTRQRRILFGLSYRTKIADAGYKLHLIYNATAQKSSASFKTSTKSADLNDYEWKINAVPPQSDTSWSSSHVVIDSTKAAPAKLAVIEAYLYGNNTNAPAMPPFNLLVSILNT